MTHAPTAPPSNGGGGASAPSGATQIAKSSQLGAGGDGSHASPVMGHTPGREDGRSYWVLSQIDAALPFPEARAQVAVTTTSW
jgi:hypothetical protein